MDSNSFPHLLKAPHVSKRILNIILVCVSSLISSSREKNCYGVVFSVNNIIIVIFSSKELKTTSASIGFRFRSRCIYTKL